MGMRKEEDRDSWWSVVRTPHFLSWVLGQGTRSTELRRTAEKIFKKEGKMGEAGWMDRQTGELISFLLSWALCQDPDHAPAAPVPASPSRELPGATASFRSPRPPHQHRDRAGLGAMKSVP